MAIRMRLKLGGPPPKEDIAQVQRAVMARTRPQMMQNLHSSADLVAAAAASDAALVAADTAAAVKAKLPTDKRQAFGAAVTKAGITGDESAYITQVEQRIGAAIKSFDPDISGIVDTRTGKVIVQDN